MAKFKPLTEDAFNKASARIQKSSLPFATAASFDRRSGKVRIVLSTSIEMLFDPNDAFGLMYASPDELADVQVEGAGGSIYFPKLDADFSISRLLEGFLGPLDWARKERAAQASRENGKKGGRPRKIHESEAA